MGSITIITTLSTSYALKSTENAVLKNIKSVIGKKTLSKSRLEFAPRMVIDKYITAEKSNW